MAVRRRWWWREVVRRHSPAEPSARDVDLHSCWSTLQRRSRCTRVCIAPEARCTRVENSPKVYHGNENEVLFGTFIGGTTQSSLHDFFGCADNLFLLSHLCSSGHGAWGQCVPCWGASKTPRGKQIRAGMPAQPPQMPSPKSTLDLGQGGRFAEGSGKRRKIWPRGRFGLIFGANPI